jgi:uncharacterized membrane protein
MIHLTQILLICASLWCFQGQFEVQFTGGNNSLGGLDIDMMVMTIVMMMMMVMITSMMLGDDGNISTFHDDDDNNNNDISSSDMI